MKMKMKKAICMTTALALAAGCAPIGTDFVRPTSDSVVLGTTTEAEVRAKYGKPRTERSWGRQDVELAREVGAPFGAARVSGTMSELDYYFEDRMGDAAAKGVSPSKSVKFWFHNGKLAGWKSHSSFRADSSAFDEKKVQEITAWKSLRGDVVRLMGPPAGVRIHPMVPGEDQQMLTWFTFEFDTSLRETRARTLDVLVNGIGVVLDVRYAGSAKPLPPPPAPTYVPVPIYIPRQLRARGALGGVPLGSRDGRAARRRAHRFRSCGMPLSIDGG
jgi:hypothetical protein